MHAIQRDEYTATATLAVVALLRREAAPNGTPLQRAASRAALRAYCNRQLAAMRARVHS